MCRLSFIQYIVQHMIKDWYKFTSENRYTESIFQLRAKILERQVKVWVYERRDAFSGGWWDGGCTGCKLFVLHFWLTLSFAHMQNLKTLRPTIILLVVIILLTIWNCIFGSEYIFKVFSDWRLWTWLWDCHVRLSWSIRLVTARFSSASRRKNQIELAFSNSSSVTDLSKFSHLMSGLIIIVIVWS